jgi:hypothetical protein
LRRRWSLSGREGFGFLSPSRRGCEAGFSAFQEMKRLFFTTPNAKKRRPTGVTEVTGRWTGRGLYLTGRVRSVLSICACLGILIGRGSASGHDRPDTSGYCGCLLDSNWTLALWRLVRLAARPVATRWSAARLDQRVRSLPSEKITPYLHMRCT